MEEKERIVGMLSSGEEELMRLGAIMALGMGPEWCVETFHYMSIKHAANVRGRYKYHPVIKVPNGLRREIYVKNGVAISFLGPYVDCDYYYRFQNEATASPTFYTKIINLDNDET